jgi:hypothetical protein
MRADRSWLPGPRFGRYAALLVLTSLACAFSAEAGNEKPLVEARKFTAIFRKWYISHAGWKHGALSLAPLVWHDGLDGQEASLPPGR